MGFLDDSLEPLVTALAPQATATSTSMARLEAALPGEEALLSAAQVLQQGVRKAISNLVDWRFYKVLYRRFIWFYMVL